jgi:hypothetical protein
MINYRELEETLCRLQSVDALRVVGEADRITEVHVLAAPEKAPKQVVRDIQSLAMARYGVSLDRRVISVVQITPEQIAARGAGGDRAQIVGIREEPDGNRVTAIVTLSWQGDEVTGSSTGPSAASYRIRLVGEATLKALEELLGGSSPLALDAIGTPAVGMRDLVVAVVVSTTDKGEAVAVGSALNNGEASEAAVRAVLDAMNRRIPELLR